MSLKDVSPDQAVVLTHFKIRTIDCVAVQEVQFEVARELIQTEWLKFDFTEVVVR